MKQIEVIIKPFKLDEVQNALGSVGITAMTVTEVKGFGRQKGHTEMYRGAEYFVDFVAKIRLEMVVEDQQLEPATQAILSAAHTGKVGDGKVFVRNVTRAVRIRTGEQDGDAL